MAGPTLVDAEGVLFLTYEVEARCSKCKHSTKQTLVQQIVETFDVPGSVMMGSCESCGKGIDLCVSMADKASIDTFENDVFEKRKWREGTVLYEDDYGRLNESKLYAHPLYRCRTQVRLKDLMEELRTADGSAMIGPLNQIRHFYEGRAATAVSMIGDIIHRIPSEGLSTCLLIAVESGCASQLAAAMGKMVDVAVVPDLPKSTLMAYLAVVGGRRLSLLVHKILECRRGDRDLIEHVVWNLWGRLEPNAEILECLVQCVSSESSALRRKSFLRIIREEFAETEGWEEARPIGEAMEGLVDDPDHECRKAALEMIRDYPGYATETAVLKMRRLKRLFGGDKDSFIRHLAKEAYRACRKARRK